MRPAHVSPLLVRSLHRFGDAMSQDPDEPGIPPRDSRDLGFVRRIWVLTWEFLSTQDLVDPSALIRLPARLRAVPPIARGATLALLLFLAVLIVATPLSTSTGLRSPASPSRTCWETLGSCPCPASTSCCSASR